ncbi:probable NAD(P)H dehydrogenase subunit CRR3, chloroplastic isoform X2 [Jatropha curcas]|uniref:probable NAD(P)H dehydrogenase subunit CRR3, chloroplastic isoform X2 n=1 Tax=Jatropha curcas TaxID=180498 RepID=UPI00189456A7|nr:probable NAD(P)H dehydrogenase subunit CRR3, chloroplastic isoform X2 [Jatropha curcas]
MACLSCHCTTKTLVFACLHNPTNCNDSPPPKPNTTNPNKPPIPITKRKTRPRIRQRQSKLQQQLNLIRIERAVGAGSYRDSDPTGSEERDRDSIFKGLLPNSAGALESPVEKKLRETGEWIVDKSEGEFRSSGKKNFDVFLSVGSANLHFHVPSDFWSHKATLQHAST